MTTLNVPENSQLFGLTEVKANPEAFAAHEERAKYSALSRCPLKEGDIVTISDKPDDLVGSSFYNNRWNEALCIKVNGENQNISLTILAKERANIDGGIATVDGDLNQFTKDNKHLLIGEFREKLAAEAAGEYLVHCKTFITKKIRLSDEKQYVSAETFYQVNKKA